jgi:hypothetical protein
MAKEVPNKAKPDLTSGIQHEGQNHATLLENTQVWGESWEQIVVDATLWDITPAAIDSFPCGPGILLKRHSLFIDTCHLHQHSRFCSAPPRP